MRVSTLREGGDISLILNTGVASASSFIHIIHEGAGLGCRVRDGVKK